MSKMLQSAFRSRIAVVAFFSYLMLMAAPAVGAAESRVVRVGWFSQPGYMEILPDGSRYGYAYEYLKTLAQYTGWRYEFIDGGTKDLEDRLAKGELDMLGCLQYSQERAERFLMPQLESGIVYNSIFVRMDSPLVTNDYVSFNGLKIAVRGPQNSQVLLEYAREHDFKVTLVFYGTIDQIYDAVLNKEVDAGAMGGFQPSNETRSIARYAPRPFYFFLNKKESQLLHDLNKAQSEMRLANPYFDKVLANKYLPAVNKYFELTKEEQAFVINANYLTVSYKKSWAPLSLATPDPKAFKGIIADYFAKVSKLTGLKFKYVVEKDPSEIDRGVDIIAAFEQNFDAADRNGFSLTEPYLRLPMTLVKKAGHKSVQPLTGTSLYYYSYQAMDGKNNRYRLYSTAEACMDAVRDNKIDQALINAMVANYMLTKSTYRSLYITPIHGLNFNVCMAVNSNLDPRLMSILKKAIYHISDAEMNAMIVSNTIDVQKTSLRTIINQMPVDVLFVFSLVLLLALISLLFFMNTRAKAAKKIEELLYIDELTGNMSFNKFRIVAQNLLKTASDRSRYVLLYMNIVKFKSINDAYGYLIGDNILKNVSLTMARMLKPGEFFARVYADRFVMLLKYQSREQFDKDFQSFVEQVNDSSICKNMLIHLSFSAGAYQLSNEDSSINSAIDRSNYAREQAVAAYHSTCVFYDDELKNRLITEHDFEREMEAALQNGDFTVFYQPKINSTTGALTGAEALVRWQHATKGLLPPSAFIPLFEKNGFIMRLDLYVFEQVCKKLAEWQAAGLKLVPVSCNFSRRHIISQFFVDELCGLTERYGIPRHYLEVEITETIAMEDTQQVRVYLQKLGAAGFSIAIDDFGSGYSSLGIVSELPFDIIKLDRSLIVNAVARETDMCILTGIVTIFNSLNKRIVCEGVEQEEQVALLNSLSPNIVIQGYYYSKPIPIEDFKVKYMSR